MNDQTQTPSTKPDSAASALSAGLCLCDDGVRIVYEHGKPSGIRDSGGYLFFFRDIMKYEGQDERYRQEREQQQALAEFLLGALQRHNAALTGAEGVRVEGTVRGENPGKD